MQNIYQAELGDSTLDDITCEDENHVRRLLRLLVLLAVCAVVALGLLGAFDREQSALGHADGLDVNAQFPAVTRAGHEIRLRVELSSFEPLPPSVTLSLTEEYLEMFEDFSAFPEPESQSTQGDGTAEFEVAPAHGARSMVATFTGRASDQWSPRTSGTLGIVAQETHMNIELKTWRVP